jgi:hypothetical protein
MGTTGPKGPSFMMRVERGTFASIVGLKISVDSQFLRPRAVSNRVGPDLRPPHVRMLIKALAEPGASPPLPLSSGLARGPTSYRPRQQIKDLDAAVRDALSRLFCIGELHDVAGA